jgi:PAS domain S-box-containing protein
MFSAASLMLALLHLLLWLKDHNRPVYALSALMAAGASASAYLELALLQTESIERYATLLRLENLAIFALLIPMVWFVYLHFGTARRWLAVTITATWGIAIVVNFLSPFSLVFSDIAELRRLVSYWGESFSIAVGPANPWKPLADLASILIAVYVIDASIHAWRRGDRHRALVVGGSITFFIVAAGIHTPLVDAGLVATPYMISVAFLAIVLAQSYELVTEAVKAPRLAQEVAVNERRWRTLMEEVQLAVVGVDTDGRISYSNPFVQSLLGYESDELIGRPVAALLPPDEAAEFEQRFERALQQGPRPFSQWSLLTRSGDRREVAWSSVGLFSGDGTVTGILAIGADVTREREAEAARDLALQQIESLKQRLEEENIYLKQEISEEQGFRDLIGESDPMRYVHIKIAQVARTDATVLVQGETGVGKELVARAVHEASARSDRPFIKVNCAALPPNLIESELFGHERGAFTGAVRQRKGRFELADGGTLFLDEVAELPLDLQVKLLRVLQEGELERVGGMTTIKVDVRIIAATNRSLGEEVAAGRFREDLFYRLNVYPVTVPPLRQRIEDIPALVAHFARRIGDHIGKTVDQIPAATLAVLQSYSWPGNVRELENVIERAVITTPDSTLRLAESLGQDRGLEGDPETAGELPVALELEEVERRHIEYVLGLTDGRISGDKGAARLLGLNPSTLRSRMAKLGLIKTA